MPSLPRHHWLSIESVGDLTLIRFSQADLLDEELSRSLGETLCSLVEDHERRYFVVNLAKVQRLTSILIGKLVGLHKRALKAGGRLVLCQPSPAVRETLDTLRLTQMVPVYASEAEALQSF